MPAAIESPSDTMNVVPAHESAIWCAASGAAPSQPIMIAAAVNAPLSKNKIPEVGSPSFNISFNRTPDSGAHHNRGHATRVAGSRRSHSKITPTAITREINVASPAPASPIAGAPRCPQIKIQFSPTLSPTLPSMMNIGTHGRPSASANCRSARYTNTGVIDAPISRKNGFTAANTSGGC